MFRSTIKSLTLSVSAACLMIYSPSAEAGQTIKIGVAANFANALSAIIADFNTYYAAGDHFTYTIDSTANLKAAILAGGTTTGAPYDLFLSADTAAPAAVSTLGMVYSGATQTPFFYATGSIVLAAESVNIDDCPTPASGHSCGLPTTGSSVYTHFVIADPSKAPYGFAAMQVLNQAPWSLGLVSTATYPVATFPASYVYTQANIAATYSAVSGSPPAYAYGFVAKSSVCKNGTLDPLNPIKYVYEYVYNGAAGLGHTASTTSQNYPQIIQNGIAIERGQTSTTKAEVIKFINYILGAGDGKGTTVRTQYCYGTIHP